MTKDEITQEYGKVLSILGERTYRALVPFVEMTDLLLRALHLNHEMHALITKEKDSVQSKEK